MAANDYIDAAQKYIAGYSEERAVVRNGKRTGEKKRITVQGVVTWTPGIDKWMKDNRSTVEGMLQAFMQGGDALKASPKALTKASEIATEVFNEQGADAAYWEKYYKGVVERDKQGLQVELGGSSVNNLADNMLLFGLASGSSNLFAATYTVFGNIVKQQYPELMPTYPPVNEILDVSYVRSLASRSAPTSTEMAQAKPKFEEASQPKETVSRRSWRIKFATGRASFTGAAGQQLGALMKDLLIAGNTVVEIHGHTDSVGSPDANMQLSEARAFAVKSWLEKRAPANFPRGRIRVFAHGQQQPMSPNTTEAGRAQNRRVDVVLKAQE